MTGNLESEGKSSLFSQEVALPWTEGHLRGRENPKGNSGKGKKGKPSFSEREYFQVGLPRGGAVFAKGRKKR